MKAVYFLPLAIFVLVGAALLVGLGLNPSLVPSARVGTLAPDFDMEPLYEGEPSFSRESLNDGEIKLVNVWGSWCIPCRAEHPVLMQLKAQGIKIHGINQKDDPDDAKRFLENLGNSYALIGKDEDTRVSIEWGISGVPETFVVDGEGKILYQHIGPMTREIVVQRIRPFLQPNKD